MSTYYKFSGTQYNQDTREFTTFCRVLHDDPQFPGVPQPYEGFDGVSIVVPDPSPASVKSACASFATKVQSLFSLELAQAHNAVFGLAGNVVIEPPPP